MSFGDINIIERIGESQSLADAFNSLRGLEFLTLNMGSSYQPLEGRRDFVIVTDVGEKDSQLLHPYGTKVVYAFRNLLNSESR
jgi:hypothetical protein